MSLYNISTPAGPVTIEAASCQVDDSGHLGFFDESGKMIANFWHGEWYSGPTPPPEWLVGNLTVPAAPDDESTTQAAPAAPVDEQTSEPAAEPPAAPSEPVAAEPAAAPNEPPAAPEPVAEAAAPPAPNPDQPQLV